MRFPGSSTASYTRTIAGSFVHPMRAAAGAFCLVLLLMLGSVGSALAKPKVVKRTVGTKVSLSAAKAEDGAVTGTISP